VVVVVARALSLTFIELSSVYKIPLYEKNFALLSHTNFFRLHCLCWFEFCSANRAFSISCNLWLFFYFFSTKSTLQTFHLYSRICCQAGSKPLNFCLARKNNVFVVSQSFAFLIGSLVVRTQKDPKRAPPQTLYNILSTLNKPYLTTCYC
jgi:hypothetical protein